MQVKKAQKSSKPVSAADGPMTLRKLLAMLEPEYLDAPLTIRVMDAHNNVACCRAPRDLWDCPRRPGYASTGEPPALALSTHLSGYRLVREKQ